MKRNRVWVIEGYDKETKSWTPCWGQFYYHKKVAQADIVPGQMMVTSNNLINYRVRPYYAEEKKL
jgi:hypothetical protein